MQVSWVNNKLNIHFTFWIVIRIFVLGILLPALIANASSALINCPNSNILFTWLTEITKDLAPSCGDLSIFTYLMTAILCLIFKNFPDSLLVLSGFILVLPCMGINCHVYVWLLIELDTTIFVYWVSRWLCAYTMWDALRISVNVNENVLQLCLAAHMITSTQREQQWVWSVYSLEWSSINNMCSGANVIYYIIARAILV